MLYETPVGFLNPVYAKTELSEDLGLVFSWPNKDPVVDTEGHKKRNALGLRAMNFLLLLFTLCQKAEI